MDYAALLALKADFEGLNPLQAEAKGRELYRALYFDGGKPVGTRYTHDGQAVAFHWSGSSGFEHAFFTSSDLTGHPFRKDLLDIRRLERIPWIGPLIRGEVSGSEYRKEHFWRSGKRLHKRLYLLRPERYLVWLEPREDGGWKFATAYVASGAALKEYDRKTVVSVTF